MNSEQQKSEIAAPASSDVAPAVGTILWANDGAGDGGYFNIAGIDGGVYVSTNGRRARWQNGRLELLPSQGQAPGANGQKPSKPRPVAEYNYTDKHGRILFQKLRFENPKRFEQRRPSGEGWIYNLQGVERVLYNLPAVIAAEDVYVVEGEKDADRLNAAGLVATTAGGAGQWRPEFSSTLADKTVIIIPDNDKAGIDGARKIAARLAGAAAQVRYVELPGVGPGGDVSDWLDAGGDVEQLQELCRAAPVYNGPGTIDKQLKQQENVTGGEFGGGAGRSGIIPQTRDEVDTGWIKRNVDLLSLVPGEFEKVAGTGGGEWAGPCPFCGGKDRFHIQQEHPDLGGRWFCRQCHEQWGDAIDYVMLRDGCDFKEAAAALGAPTVPEPGAAAFSANGQKPAGQVGDIAIPVPINGAEFAARKFDPLHFLIDDLIAREHLVLLAGRPKGGKSWLALTMAMCIDSAVTFLGKWTQPARVLYLALEDGQRRMNSRIAALKWQPGRTDFLFHIAQFDGPGGDLGPGLVQLRELTARYDLIVIDTLIRTLSGQADENSNTRMGAILNGLASIAHDTNTAILVIHHTGKGQADDPFEKLRGASAIRGAYDVGLILDRRQGEREAILYAESRDVDVNDMTLRHAANGAGWEYLGPGYQIESIRAGRKTLEAMLSHPEYLDGLTAADIADVRDVTERAVRQQLISLELSGYVVRESPKSTVMGKRPDIWHVSESYRG